MTNYVQWLEEERKGREGPAHGDGPTFSILTTVYSGTDAGLLALTADSVSRQSYRASEWVLLAHGPISDATSSVLSELSLQPWVTVLKLEANLGIMGGMRYCLERAHGEYIVPLDADDLLAPDALASFAARLRDRPPAAFSDEDIYVDGPAVAYLRPGWDPVLNLESSYVWHLVAIRRDMALDLGLYSDPGAEWCHDWDTIFRLERAGTPPIHVPSVLYHWRQHAGSSTNKPDPESGSMRSQKHVLSKRVEANRYDIVRSPINRGSPEWWVKRREESRPPVEVVLLARGDAANHATICSIERHGVHIPAIHQAALSAPSPMGELLAAVSRMSAPYVLVLAGGMELQDAGWYHDGIKQLELHPDVHVVCGQVVNIDGIVLTSGGTYDGAGELTNPSYGKSARDPGPFAMALKAHTVSAAPTDAFLVRRDALLRALHLSGASDQPIDQLGTWLSAHVACHGGRTAFTPYFRSMLVQEVPLDGGAGMSRAAASDVYRLRYGALYATVRHGLGPTHRLQRILAG